MNARNLTHVPEWLAVEIRSNRAAPNEFSLQVTPKLASGVLATPYGAKVLAEKCHEIETCPPGNQSNNLVGAATRVGSFIPHEIDYDHALQAIMAAAMRMANLSGHPKGPWTAKTIADQVTRALAVGMADPNRPGAHLTPINTSGITAGGKPLGEYQFNSSAEGQETVRGEQSKQRYRLLTSSAVTALTPHRYRVKGVLPAQGVCSIYGPSASAKSFLVMSLAVSITNGNPWFGHRVRQGSVAYVVLEGEAGIGARLQACEIALGERLPQSLRLVINQPFNLTDKTDVGELALAIQELCGPEPVVFVDTLNRAAAGLDENSSKDMGEIIRGLSTLQSLTSGLIVIVTHTGKDATKGVRGHSSMIAALDAAIEVIRNGDQRSWRLAKSKDGVDGETHNFRLEVISLGNDEDGDAITSCVVVAEIGESQKTQRISRADRLALDALENCRAGAIEAPAIVLAGIPRCSGTTVFPPAVVVHEAVWRDQCYLLGISGGKQASKAAAFRRSKDTLLELGVIRTMADHYWLPAWSTLPSIVQRTE